jgi:hypothetical protein
VVNLDSTSLPLFGLVGPEKELTFTEAIDTNERFYKYMDTGMDIGRIVVQVNADFHEEILFCSSALGSSRFARQRK